MGENDVYDWFKRMRLTGCHDWFSMNAVYMRMREEGCEINNKTVRRSINQLHSYGFLDMRTGGVFERYFRLKDRYLPGMEGVLVNGR